MIFGIASGLATAVMQSTSYVCSRVFIHRHKSAVALAVYSQLLMGFMAAFVFLFVADDFHFPATPGNLRLLAGLVLSTAAGQVCFFLAAAEIEASRLSSLTGLKIIVLALLCQFVRHEDLGFQAWVAVLLCTLAALGMNFSGLRIRLKGAFWLGLTLLLYSAGDIFIKLLIGVVEGPNAVARSIGAAALSYALLGLVSLPALFFVRRSPARCRDSLGYACAWFGAMLLLFYSLTMVSVVFINIIVASRGIISVLMGAAMARMGHTHLEPGVSRAIWFRRLVMSVLMLLAMALYVTSDAG